MKRAHALAIASLSALLLAGCDTPIVTTAQAPTRTASTSFRAAGLAMPDVEVGQRIVEAVQADARPQQIHGLHIRLGAKSNNVIAFKATYTFIQAGNSVNAGFDGRFSQISGKLLGKTDGWTGTQPKSGQ